MQKEVLFRVLLSALKMMVPAALGALGAAMLLVYPEGFHAFCTQ